MAKVLEVKEILIVLNMEGLHIREGDLSFMCSTVKRLYKAGKGICLMKILGGGKSANRADEDLRYCLQHSVRAYCIGGKKTIGELEAAVRAEKEVDEQNISGRT